MEWLRITGQMYRLAFGRGATLAAKNWPVLGTLFIYGGLLEMGTRLAAPLGFAGGFLISLLFAACTGSFLAMVESIVRSGKVSLADFRTSFGTYLWDVLGVSFVLWVLFQVAALALAPNPQGWLFLLFAQIAVFVFFNAVPELIYLGRFSALELLRASYDFIADNWPEWFPANFALAGLIALVSYIPLPGLGVLLLDAAVALLLYFAMIVRGILFLQLHGSSRRSRAFRHRVGDT